MARFFLTLLASIGVSIAYAGIPQTINYQGYLADASGSPIDTLVPITFNLYTVSTGGSPVWSETQGIVAVDQGLFSVQLGNITPLTQNLFNLALYIGIEVDGDAEMVPRRPLSLAAYAFQANDAFTVGGQSAFALDQSAHVAATDNPHSVTAAQAGAASSAELSALVTQIDNLASQVSTLQTDRANADVTISSLQSSVDLLQAGLSDETTARINADSGLQNSVNSISANSVLALDSFLTLSGDTAQFSGVNVQIVSGAGATDAAPNGTGNLIVGYDAPGGLCFASGSLSPDYTNEAICLLAPGGSWTPGDKTGSHNLIVGDGHTYSSFGGLVAGHNNRIMGTYASASGGQSNTAFANLSSVSAGRGNVSGDPAFGDSTVGESSSISGGRLNTASGTGSSVSGGRFNTASGNNSSVSGGLFNTASGNVSSVGVGGSVTCAADFCAEGMVTTP